MPQETTTEQVKDINAQAERLYALLAGDGYYEVPPYQRDYSWEAEQWSKLADDFLRAGSDGKTNFLGAMVFVIENESNRRYEVLDGQQRFATLLLLLRALQLTLQQRGAGSTTMSQIENMVFAPDVYGNTDTGDPFVHIQLNDEDREYYTTTLTDGTAPDPMRGSHKLIKKAFEFFIQKFDDHVPHDPDELNDYWSELRKGLASRLYIIRVEVRDAVDAQMVFEALNSAGVDLTAADLVKNHLLRTVPKTTFDSAYAHWRSMVEQVGDEYLSRYLRASWNSKYDFAREAELYREVTDLVVASPGKSGRKVSAATYVMELDEESLNWVDLRNADGASWASQHPDLRDDLNDLRSLDARLVYVPLLALREVFKTDVREFAKAVRWFRDFYVRHTIVGGRAANEVEEDYSKWATQIRKGAMTLPELHGHLVALSPNDASFEASFESMQVKRLLTARVLLARVNDSVNKSNTLSQTIMSGQKIHVEHVIPQKPNSEWEKFLKDRKINHDEVVNSVGNLTLLLGPKNIRASNKSFEEKKPKYVATEAPINKYLATLSEFGSAELESKAARQTGAKRLDPEVAERAN